jgi:chemotaxis protein methyltransferase CheR
LTSGLIGPAELAEIQEAVRRSCGLLLIDRLRHTLRSAFAAAASELGLDGPALLARVRARDPAALAVLVENTVVGETYFFRHPEQFALLRHLLSRDVRSRPLRIWSAACASGEEPYSLAMVLLEGGHPTARGQILATDVSERALRKARAGVYGAWSLRHGPPPWAARFLRGEVPRVEVDPEVRGLVRFERHNLLADVAPEADLDLVLCRNVLIYFEPDTVRSVLETLSRALRAGGLLLLAPVELPLAAGSGLEVVEDGFALLRRAPGPGMSGRAPSPRLEPRPPPGGRRESRPSPQAAAPAGAPTPARPPAAPEPSRFDEAREAARRGDPALAERIALAAPPDDPRLAECFLLLAMAAEARGDDEAAVGALRRALYLEPGLAVAHASLVPLFSRLGDRGGAERSRRNALAALEGVAEDAPLRAVEPLTAGALRRALGAHGPRPGRGGGR